jgi:hypothetical protein
MRFLAALFLVIAALTSPVLAQLDTANVQRTEAIGCRLGKRTGEGLGQLVSFWVHAGQFGRPARGGSSEEGRAATKYMSSPASGCRALDRLGFVISPHTKMG